MQAKNYLDIATLIIGLGLTGVVAYKTYEGINLDKNGWEHNWSQNVWQKSFVKPKDQLDIAFANTKKF